MNERGILFPPQVKELELSLQASEEKLKHSDDVLAAQEAQIQELVSGPGPLMLDLYAFAAVPDSLRWGLWA